MRVRRRPSETPIAGTGGAPRALGFDDAHAASSESELL